MPHRRRSGSPRVVVDGIEGPDTLHGTTVHSRTAPRHLEAWMRRIDRWIADASSVVAE
jgi:hypothetical protein